MDLNPCMGYPVRYDPKCKYVSVARGYWRWKRIDIGPAFLQLSDREKGACLLHEAGHCTLRHAEKRILNAWLILFGVKRLLAYWHAQELEADRYAAACGYGMDMVQFLSRFTRPQRWPMTHPEPRERIAHLTNFRGA